MKTISRAFFRLGLFFLPLAMAWSEEPPPGISEGYEPLKIEQTCQAVYPQKASVAGFNNGEAHVVITVDAAGTLTDWLVVGYNCQAFADEAVRVLKQWKYQPAHLQGEPVPVVMQIDFNFDTNGATFVTQNLQEEIHARFIDVEGDHSSYRVHTLKELDHIPVPVRIVQPVYPLELEQKGIVGTVMLEFYIDETGRVRLPSVVNNAPAPLPELAMTALQQWQFAPPTCKGRPVLVRAKQKFKFEPPKPEPVVAP